MRAVNNKLRRWDRNGSNVNLLRTGILLYVYWVAGSDKGLAGQRRSLVVANKRDR